MTAPKIGGCGPAGNAARRYPASADGMPGTAHQPVRTEPSKPAGGLTNYRTISMQNLTRFGALLFVAGLLLSTDSTIQEYARQRAAASGYDGAIVTLAGLVLVLWSGMAGAE